MFEIKQGLPVLAILLWVSTASALPPCLCTRNIRPVCGTDGITYSNKCLLDCENFKGHPVTAVKEGSCDDPGYKSKTCFCTFEYSPICGTDGRTYSSLCELNCYKAKTAYQGPCKRVQQCICTLIDEPVCGNDGKSYSNECMLNCEKLERPSLKVAYQGLCS